MCSNETVTLHPYVNQGFLSQYSGIIVLVYNYVCTQIICTHIQKLFFIRHNKCSCIAVSILPLPIKEALYPISKACLHTLTKLLFVVLSYNGASPKKTYALQVGTSVVTKYDLCPHTLHIRTDYTMY